MPAGIQPGAFAIPINAVTKILAELRAGGSVRRALLGTRVRDALATPALLPQGGGALVLSVEQGGAAEAAGIKAGDVITRFGGKWVKDAVHLSQLVADSRPGDQIQVEIIRQEVLSEVSVTLGAADAPQTPREVSSSGPYGAKEEGGREF
jgi:serine protease Do